ncbi:MAG: DNA-processing protein DprA [Clostridia bacterium]|nr:DNA-processing protein DprA [Clostridia bacterium]
MERAIAWVLLAQKNRQNRKMRALSEEYEKKIKSVDYTSSEAMAVGEEIEKALKAGYGFITYMDKDYPEELRNIAYPPPYLFLRGNRKLLSYPVKAAIVGSREATSYGMNVAANFAHELADNNVCIVSGGARGIDTAAIRGAMRVSTKIIVVIGTGIDKDYPPENADLFKKVSEVGGLIISEFPLGMGPLGQNFPVRNRIMTALSDTVTIVEAAERSGALISASHANEQGKSVFAVPGNIDSPNSAGTNALLRDGAMFALSGSDILYEMMDRIPQAFQKAKSFGEEEEEPVENIKITEKAAPKNEDGEKNNHLSPFEQAILNALKSGKETYEEIQEFTLMEAGKLTSVLTIMEIKGIIKLAFRNKYKLND